MSDVPPRVSVVMPVRNAARYVDEAIASILAQSFQDFEVVCLDDGSIDSSTEVMETWARRDPRVRVFTSDSPPGPAASSNAAVARARGELVARMDADDVARPDRLARQVDVMDRRPDCVLVGSLATGIDSSGRSVRSRDRSRLLAPGLFSPFPHTSAMFRRSAFDEVGRYRARYDGWEDLDLWIRLSLLGTVLVIPDALVAYRYRHDSATSGMELERSARAIALYNRFVYEVERGSAYHEVDPDVPLSPDELAPALADAYATHAALTIWAGVKPIVPPAGVSGRKVMFYRTLGRLSPKFVRRLMALWVKLRDRRAEAALGDASEIAWSFAAADSTDPAPLVEVR